MRSSSPALCRVAIPTVEPETSTGSITPKGVTRPVRPTLTSIESSLVVTSSGGNLKAIAQRGAFAVEPSWSWTVALVELDDDPVDLVLDGVPVLAEVLDVGPDVVQRGRQPRGAG